MSDFEVVGWLSHGPDAAGTPLPRSTVMVGPAPPPGWLLITVGSWAAAALAAFLAPFLSVTTISVNRAHVGIDGWGRGPFRAGGLGGVHFGIALWIGGVALAAVAVILGTLLHRADTGVDAPPATARLGFYAALVAPGFIAGVTLSIYLTSITYVNQLNLRQSQSSSSGARVHAGVGGGVWLAVVATVASIVGAFLYLRFADPNRIVAPADFDTDHNSVTPPGTDQ